MTIARIRVRFYPMKRKYLPLAIGLVAAGLIGSGCKSTLGLAGLNVSGTFASGGKVVDAGVQVGTNSWTVDGLVSGIFGTATNTVDVTIPVAK